MKAIHNKVNIVPVIAKADTLSLKERERLKKRVSIFLAHRKVLYVGYSNLVTDKRSVLFHPYSVLTKKNIISCALCSII